MKKIKKGDPIPEGTVIIVENAGDENLYCHKATDPLAIEREEARLRRVERFKEAVADSTIRENLHGYSIPSQINNLVRYVEILEKKIEGQAIDPEEVTELEAIKERHANIKSIRGV